MEILSWLKLFSYMHIRMLWIPVRIVCSSPRFLFVTSCKVKRNYSVSMLWTHQHWLSCPHEEHRAEIWAWSEWDGSHFELYIQSAKTNTWYGNQQHMEVKNEISTLFPNNNSHKCTKIYTNIHSIGMMYSYTACMCIYSLLVCRVCYFNTWVYIHV